MLLAFDGRSPQLHETVFVAPTAVIIGDAVLGEGASVWFGAVVRADGNRIELGAGTNVQDNAVIHINARRPTVLGAGVTVGHAAVLEGCRIGDGAMIGMRAVVLDGAVVGERSLVAAGSVVREGQVIPPGVLAAGFPAEVKRPLTDADLARMAAGAEHYRELAGAYRRELRG
jgi:carbonic anhydrase/acetyltransferase-like protein (isoleucine patch superfamily)